MRTTGARKNGTISALSSLITQVQRRRALIGVVDLGYYKCLVQARHDSHNLISGVKKDAYLYANAGLALGAKNKNSAVSVLSLVTWGSTPIW